MISQSDRHPSSDRITFHLSSIFRHFQTIHCINLKIFPKKHMKKIHIFNSTPIPIPNWNPKHDYNTLAHFRKFNFRIWRVFCARFFRRARPTHTRTNLTHTQTPQKRTLTRPYTHRPSLTHIYVFLFRCVRAWRVFESTTRSISSGSVSRPRRNDSPFLFNTFIIILCVFVCSGTGWLEMFEGDLLVRGSSDVNVIIGYGSSLSLCCVWVNKSVLFE